MLALVAGCAVALSLSSCKAFWLPPTEVHPRTPAAVAGVVSAGALLVGAAVVDVTPQHPAFMAGFKFFKRHESVQGAITVRALALRRGRRTVALVGCDLIGLHLYQVQEVRRRLARLVEPGGLLVAATHNHAGPDTLGMWGLPPIKSGLDPQLTEKVLGGIVRAVEMACEGMVEVRVRWGEVEAPKEGISKNRRDPGLVDRRVTALAFDRPDGQAVATLVHFACHPETLGSKNTILSPGFPGALYATVEARRPGVCLFLNGALGGMITVDRKGGSKTVAEANRIGRAIGELALGALEPGQALSPELDLAWVSQPIFVPIQLRSFHLASSFGIFGPRPFVDGGYTPSEVWGLRLGPALLVSAPGEVLPRLGFELDALLGGEPGLLVGLGNDELGYLIHEHDWEEERYHYERGVSPGRLAAPLLRDTVRSVAETLKESRD
jgi:hypothetical protein